VEATAALSRPGYQGIHPSSVPDKPRDRAAEQTANLGTLCRRVPPNRMGR
jgi:hypothetical protein